MRPLVPLVLLDCDGILSDFVGQFLWGIYRHYGVNYDREAVTEFGFGNLPGWDDLKAKNVWSLCKQPGFVASMAVLPGAITGVSRLRAIADVEVCTSPFAGSLYWAGERDAWLVEHFGFEHHDIHHVRKKYRMNADLLVDDSGDNVEAWARETGNVGILWDRSYNRQFVATRVRSWDEVIAAVRAL